MLLDSQPNIDRLLAVNGAWNAGGKAGAAKGGVVRTRALTTYEGATGFVMDWAIAGFFPNGTECDHEPDLFEPKRSRYWDRDYLAPCGGAAAVRDIPPRRGLCAIEWLPIRNAGTGPKFFLQDQLRAYPELAAAFPGESRWDHQWYALALIQSDTAQAAELRICGNDGCQVWWNGGFVLEEHAWHKLAFDLHVVPVRLDRGRNSLLLKLDRFGFTARVTAAGGKKLRGRVRALSAAEPPSMPPGTLEQLRRYARTLKVRKPCRATTTAGLARWRRNALAHLRRCIGPFPPRPATPHALGPVEACVRDGYTRFRYHLKREAGSILPVYVLIPDDDRFNGRTVICAHGHGQDDKVVAGIHPPSKPHGNWFGPFTGNYAERLAQAGFLTAVWSERAISFERKDTPAGQDACNVASLCAQSMGMTLPGLHLFDLHGVADFVATLPGVEAGRMGLTGLSGGGTLTYLAGAYDSRFRALAVFCGILGYADYANGTDGCGQQIVPGLYPTLDVGELLGLIAPRPLLLAQGRRDVTFNIFRLRRFAREARRAYRLLGAGKQLEVHLYDLAHQVDIEAMIRFFTRAL